MCCTYNTCTIPKGKVYDTLPAMVPALSILFIVLLFVVGSRGGGGILYFGYVMVMRDDGEGRGGKVGKGGLCGVVR